MNDKKSHIIAGMLIALAVALPVWLSSNDLFAGLWACVSGIIAGGVKEWCDNKVDGNQWDWHDFAASAIGVAVVAVFIILLHFGKG